MAKKNGKNHGLDRGKIETIVNSIFEAGKDCNQAMRDGTQAMRDAIAKAEVCEKIKVKAMDELLQEINKGGQSK